MSRTQVQIEAPDFDDAYSDGEVVHEDGYHQPARLPVDCGCELTTGKGAHRDVIVDLPDGRTAYFYHQTPVVVEQDGDYRLTSGGWKTRSTRERINWYLPTDVRLRYVEKDDEGDEVWEIEVDLGRGMIDLVPFRDGVTLQER